MLMNVLDGAGVTQKIVVKGQEAIVDHSGSITATGVAQVAIAANALRSGYIIQNLSTVNPMWVNDLGAATAAQGSFKILPGLTFAPDNYGINTNAISILGTIGDLFTAREW